MTTDRLIVSDDVLTAAITNIKTLTSDLTVVQDRSHEAAGAVGGNDCLIHSLNDFGDNWDQHRANLLKQLDLLCQQAQTVSDGFKDADDKTGQAISDAAGPPVAAVAAAAGVATAAATATAMAPRGSGDGGTPSSAGARPTVGNLPRVTPGAVQLSAVPTATSGTVAATPPTGPSAPPVRATGTVDSPTPGIPLQGSPSPGGTPIVTPGGPVHPGPPGGHHGHHGHHAGQHDGEHHGGNHGEHHGGHEGRHDGKRHGDHDGHQDGKHHDAPGIGGGSGGLGGLPSAPHFGLDTSSVQPEAHGEVEAAGQPGNPAIDHGGVSSRLGSAVDSAVHEVGGHATDATAAGGAAMGGMAAMGAGASASNRRGADPTSELSDEERVRAARRALEELRGNEDAEKTD